MSRADTRGHSPPKQSNTQHTPVVRVGLELGRDGGDAGVELPPRLADSAVRAVRPLQFGELVTDRVGGRVGVGAEPRHRLPHAVLRQRRRCAGDRQQRSGRNRD